jgi:hypothetical protein
MAGRCRPISAMTSEEKLFRFVSRIFAEFCQQNGLAVTVSAAEKEGSFVWEAAADVEGLTRAITFSLTPVEPWPCYSVSVALAAENARAFAHHVFEQWTYVSFSAAAVDIATGHIEKALSEGWVTAGLLTAADLAEKPRRPRAKATAR